LHTPSFVSLSHTHTHTHTRTHSRTLSLFHPPSLLPHLALPLSISLSLQVPRRAAPTDEAAAYAATVDAYDTENDDDDDDDDSEDEDEDEEEEDEEEEQVIFFKNHLINRCAM